MNAPEPEHIGIISITAEALLRMLQIDGAKIRGCEFNYARRTFDILIEHEEMPLTHEGDRAQEVTPMYFTESCDHGFTRVTRAGMSQGVLLTTGLPWTPEPVAAKE